MNESSVTDAKLEFCRYSHQYYGASTIWGDFPFHHVKFSQLCMSNCARVPDIANLIAAASHGQYAWYKYTTNLEDEYDHPSPRAIHVGTINKETTIIETLHEYIGNTNDTITIDRSSSVDLNRIKWIALIQMKPQYTIIKDRLPKLQSCYRGESYSYKQKWVYSHYSRDFFIVKSGDLIATDPLYEGNVEIFNVENGTWYIRFEPNTYQLMIEHENVRNKSDFFHNLESLDQILEHMLGGDIDSFWETNENQKLRANFQGGINRLEQYCADRKRLLYEVLSFPIAVCELIVDEYELNAKHDYWWYIDKEHCQWLGEWKLHRDTVGVDTSRIAIFDAKCLSNEECVEPQIKQECELLFYEYGHQINDANGLWPLMVAETMDVATYGAAQQRWCSLPFGTAANNTSEGNSACLVKRDSVTNKVNTVLIPDTWIL